MKLFSEKYLNKILIVTLVLLQVFFNTNVKLYAETNHDLNNYKISMLQSQKVLAVADFTNDTGDPSMDYLKKGLANSLVTSLGATANNNFSIVERGQFESIIKEMGLANTGVVDVSTATKIGSAVGATQVIVGGIIKIGNTFRLNIRVIEVKTSRLNIAFSEYTQSENDILRLIDLVAQRISNSLSEPYPVAIPTPVPTVTPIPNPYQFQPSVNQGNQAEASKDASVSEQDSTAWLWIIGGIAVVGIVILVASLTKSSPQPIFLQPSISPNYPYPSTTSLPYPSVPATSIPGSTSDLRKNEIGQISPNSVNFGIKF